MRPCGGKPMFSSCGEAVSSTFETCMFGKRAFHQSWDVWGFFSRFTPFRLGETIVPELGGDFLGVGKGITQRYRRVTRLLFLGSGSDLLLDSVTSDGFALALVCVGCVSNDYTSSTRSGVLQVH